MMLKNEVKYRAKRKEDGEWVFGDLVKYRNESFLIRPPDAPESWNNEIRYYISNYWDADNLHLVDPCTIGMFVNFKDKNDEELYQHDIYKSTNTQSGTTGFYIADFHPDRFYICGYKLEDYKHLKLLKNGYNILSSNFAGQIERIGNIHDNPEFLRSKK